MDISTRYLHRPLLVGLLFIWCFQSTAEARQLVKCDSKSGLCNENEIDTHITRKEISERPLSLPLTNKHFWRRRHEITTLQPETTDTSKGLNETSTDSPWYGNGTTPEITTDIFLNTTDTSEGLNETSTDSPWYGNGTTPEITTDIFLNTTNTSEGVNETSTDSPWYGNGTTPEITTDIFLNTTDTSEGLNETSTVEPLYGNGTTQENTTGTFFNTPDPGKRENKTNPYKFKLNLTVTVL